MSSGSDYPAIFRRAGKLCGRILNERAPQNLPRRAAHKVRADHQPENCEALGLEIPAKLLATADEVIE